jgi:hypothetical protein
VHNIICITDFIGSGDQVSDFVAWLYNSKTIKSWISGGFLHIYVLAYAGVEKSINRIKAIKYIDNVTVEQPIVPGNANWTNEQTTAIQRICKDYAGKHKSPLGYNDMFTFIVFYYKCPNDSPSIFRLNSKSKAHGITWEALFPKRPDLVLKRQTLTSKICFSLKWYFNIVKCIITKNFDKVTGDELQILNCIYHRHRNTKNISRILAIPLSVVKQRVYNLQEYHLLDDTMRLTDRGRLVLSRSFKFVPMIDEPIDKYDDFYYIKR